MGLFINSSLMALSVLMLVCGMGFCIREKTSGIFRYMMGFMGVFASMWCGGYGLMGMCESNSSAYFFREVGLLGVLGYITVEYFLLMNLVKVDEATKRIVGAIELLFVVFDYVTFSSPEVLTFVRENGRTMYYGNATPGRTYHMIFIVFLSFIMTHMAWIWHRMAETKREQRFVRCSFFSNLALVISMVFDTFLPAFGLGSFPSTAYGVSITYLLIYYFASRYNAFTISASNLSGYIYDSVGASILVFDMNFRLSLANTSARKMFNLKEPYGESFRDIFKLHAENQKDLYKIISSQGHFETRLKAKQSEIRCGVNISLANDNYGDPYCMICFVTDLSAEEKRIEDMKAASRAKSAFLANMSHEIRTPINAVLGMNELIMRETTEENIFQYSGNIDKAGKNLLSLINDILDLSRMESGKFEIKPVQYNMYSLINDSYNMVRMRAMNKKLDLIVKANPDVPANLIGDEIRIRQIIINLLTNAIKYTEEGRIVMEISYREIEDDKIKLLISVSDTGIGMTKEGMNELFESFNRLEEERNRNIEGTGLGLAITKQLVDAMNGSIEVESNYGEGSVFTVILPQIFEGTDTIGEIKLDDSIASSKIYKISLVAPGARILVVDDVDMNLSVFEGLLKNTQMVIDTALSGKECLELVEKNFYDIIFMDHMMPDMDGVETFEKIKALKDNANIDTPVIMLTANAMMGVDKQYLDMGFADYLSKPIKSKYLEQVILEYLPLDFAMGLQYCAGDADFYEEMLHTYADNKRGEELATHFLNEDWENYRITVHSIKSTSLSIGANKVAQMAAELESELRAGNYDFVKENHDKMLNCYNKLVSYIKIKYYKK